MKNRARTVRFGASLLALTAAYYLAGKFGLSLAFVNASATAVWPPTGMALAVLLLFGPRLWPGVFLGAFLVNLTTQGSVATSLGIASGNTLEALLAAWLVGRMAGGRRFFEQGGTVFRFILLASVFSTMVSATVGVVTLGLGHYAHWENAAAVWLTWWLGDMVSSLLIAPLLVIWGSRKFPRLAPRQLLEGITLLGAVWVTGEIVFLKPFSGDLPLEYMALIPLLWAAFRFGAGGAVMGAFLTSGLALWGTLHGSGPFAKPDPNASLLLLQAFIGTLTVTVLILAAVIAERKRAEQRLQVQDAVRSVLIESTTLAEATPRILQALCTMAGWEVGAFWSVNPSSHDLGCLAFWKGSSLAIPEFEDMTRQHRFARGAGLPGRVWNSGQPVWLSDVTQDSNFPRAAVAAKEGLRAGICFPVKLGDDVLGVIECFSNRVRQPDPHFLRMLASIGSQIGDFIERRKAETLQGAILDSALDCIISIDQAGRIIEFNPAAEKTFGRSRASVLGQSMSELIIPPRLREQHRRGFEQYLATGEGKMMGRRIEMSALRADGVEIPVELSINVVRLGPTRAFTATLRDITERKKTEAALAEAQTQLKAHADDLEIIVAERTEELRETIAEIESFSYSISHDMRGPLRAMHGYAAILEEELKGKIGESHWNYLGRIVNAAARLNQLVQGILSYSQISRSKLALAPVDLQALLLEMKQHNPHLQPPRVEIRIEGPLPVVLGHETALMQIFSNLLGNAVKFVPAGTTPRIIISAESAGAGLVRIWVTDNGIGIDPKNFERIFQMFEQVNNPKDFEGTGIGLAIVKRAVERLGGKIGVVSELGKGSRFWFDLKGVSD